jgi:hypothetical protein
MNAVNASFASGSHADRLDAIEFITFRLRTLLVEELVQRQRLQRRVYTGQAVTGRCCAIYGGRLNAPTWISGVQ